MENALWFCKNSLRFAASITFEAFKTNPSLGRATFVNDARSCKLQEELRQKFDSAAPRY